MIFNTIIIGAGPAGLFTAISIEQVSFRSMEIAVNRPAGPAPIIICRSCRSIYCDFH